MTTKIVSQINSIGVFVGASIAYESPLEPGVFLIPAGAVDAEPPAVPEGKRATWNGNGWTLEDLPVTPGVDPDPEKTPEELLAEWRNTAVVSRFQARAALLQSGLLEQVESIMTDPETPAITRLAWSDAQEFRRRSPTILALAPLLNLSDTQLDDLFRLAAGIEA